MPFSPHELPRTAAEPRLGAVHNTTYAMRYSLYGSHERPAGRGAMADKSIVAWRAGCREYRRQYKKRRPSFMRYFRRCGRFLCCDYFRASAPVDAACAAACRIIERAAVMRAGHARRHDVAQHGHGSGCPAAFTEYTTFSGSQQYIRLALSALSQQIPASASIASRQCRLSLRLHAEECRYAL